MNIISNADTDWSEVSQHGHVDSMQPPCISEAGQTGTVIMEANWLM